MPTAIIERKQKLFRLDKLFPLDANQVNVEESIARLFILLRTGGRPITRTDKTIFIGDSPDAERPEAIFNEAFSNGGKGNFSGVDSDARKKLLCSWFESHFALMTRRGKGKGGEYRLMGLRPLHFAVIKLFNPQPKRQDRYLSDFFYTSLRDDPELVTNTDSLFKRFFGVAVRTFGESDFKIDEAGLSALAASGEMDIELLFLLRLLEPFDVDRCSTNMDDQVPDFSFLCPEQIELMRQDLKLLFLYRDRIPRRELINYMITLMVFHAALYFFQIVRIANAMVASGTLPPARGECPRPGEPRTHAPFDLNIFCDLTSGHDSAVDSLAKRRYTEVFREIEQYFKSAYLIKKLDEFAGSYLTTEQKKLNGKQYFGVLLSYLKHKDLDGYFNRDIQTIRQNGQDPDTGDYNQDVERIIEIANARKLSKLETFVDILYHFQYDTLVTQHRRLLASICGIELERGFLAGKGRARRKFVLGNELLEVLIQLAVLDRRPSDGKWYSRPISIRDFVSWLKGRYGILMDALGGGTPEDEQTNRALATNFESLKVRLRQLGFFTDLSDASNSQVIRPRFSIVVEELKKPSETVEAR
jgi:hypothetical protein